MNGTEVFKTRDFYLACFLRAKGLELIEAKEDVYENFSTIRTIWI